MREWLHQIFAITIWKIFSIINPMFTNDRNLIFSLVGCNCHFFGFSFASQTMLECPSVKSRVGEPGLKFFQPRWWLPTFDMVCWWVICFLEYPYYSLPKWVSSGGHRGETFYLSCEGCDVREKDTMVAIVPITDFPALMFITLTPTAMLSLSRRKTCIAGFSTDMYYSDRPNETCRLVNPQKFLWLTDTTLSTFRKLILIVF